MGWLFETFEKGVTSLLTLAYLEEEQNKRKQHELELARIKSKRKKVIHLHQHNYYLVDRQTGKKIRIDPEKFELTKS